MKDVMRALEKVRGAPVFSSNQCADLAMALNNAGLAINADNHVATVASVIQRKTFQFAINVHDNEVLHPGTKLYIEPPEPQEPLTS